MAMEAPERAFRTLISGYSITGTAAPRKSFVTFHFLIDIVDT
jgi:hypothetical protein